MNKKKDLWIFLGGLLVVCVYMIPYFYLGEDSVIRILDILDCEQPVYKLLKEQGALFSVTKLPLLQGVSSDMLPYSLPPKLLCYYLFSPFYAYVFNEFLVRIIGYVGMYHFLSRYFIREQRFRSVISLSVSLSFSLMPFYAVFGLGVYSMPWLVMSFSNLQRRRRIGWSFVCIFLVGIYTSFILIGFFELLVFFAYFVFESFQSRKVNMLYFGGLCLLGLEFMVAMYPQIHAFLMGEPSHRVGFRKMEMPSILSCLDSLKHTQFHTGEMPVWVLVVYTLLLLVFRKGLNKRTWAIVGCVSLLILWPWGYACLKYLFPHATLLVAFDFGRMYFLLPFAWMCLFACILASTATLFRKPVYALLVIVFLGLEFRSNFEFLQNTRHMVTGKYEGITYAQFYDEPLFQKIEDELHVRENNWKVVSLGMYSSVALYNNYYSLDGYDTIYPLSYKNRFRPVIAGELDKSEELRDYYDNWGNRCYLFCAELGKNNYKFSKKENRHVEHLAIDTQALRSLDCGYIFSAVYIDNYQELNLTYCGAFTTPDSYWEVKVYKL